MLHVLLLITYFICDTLCAMILRCLLYAEIFYSSSLGLGLGLGLDPALRPESSGLGLGLGLEGPVLGLSLVLEGSGLVNIKDFRSLDGSDADTSLTNENK